MNRQSHPNDLAEIERNKATEEMRRNSAGCRATTETVVLPSVVGVGETELGLLSLGRLGRDTKRPHTIEWDGQSYLVGDHVGDFGRPVERMGFARLGDGLEPRALTYATLGLLLGRGNHAAALMVGLPVEVMSDKSLALSTRRALRRWLVGTHHFVMDGFPVTLTVERVQVLAQPAGCCSPGGCFLRIVDDRKVDHLLAAGQVLKKDHREHKLTVCVFKATHPMLTIHNPGRTFFVGNQEHTM